MLEINRHNTIGNKPNQLKIKISLGLLLSIVVCYVNYQIIPIFYKHMLLKDMMTHGLKEQVRVTAFNGHMARILGDKVIKPYFQETLEEIGFATTINLEISSVKYPNEEIITVECSGSIPIDLLVYTSSYNIYERQTQVVNKGDY